MVAGPHCLHSGPKQELEATDNRFLALRHLARFLLEGLRQAAHAALEQMEALDRLATERLVERALIERGKWLGTECAILCVSTQGDMQFGSPLPQQPS